MGDWQDLKAISLEERGNAMIREIHNEDIKDCVKVITTSFQTVADEFGFTRENAPRFVAFATNEDMLRRWMDEEKRPMYGYYEEDVMIGYYNLKISNDQECELGSLSVLPEYRHQGIGVKLLQDAIQKAKDLSCAKMKLSIVEENYVLRRWYEQNGFTHTGTEKYDFFPFTCGYMERDLIID